jgi:hypothetical protein
MFFNNPHYDFFIMSMELAHRALAEFYVENNYTHPYERANDYVDVGFKVMSDWLLFRKATVVPIFLYDVRYLIHETDRIRSEIQAGTAPSGVNGYWAGQPDSPAKEEILHWLGHH